MGTVANQLCVATNDNGTNGTGQLIRGRFDLGNISLGNQKESDSDIALADATNIIKINNGTIGTAAPSDGGYFYAKAGTLHWVDSNGTDTRLSAGYAQASDPTLTDATQILQLFNGTVGTVAPAAGGYFYVTGGVLHWVDSAGNDNQLSLSAAGQLAAQALSAYTNNAGSSSGTLTNAPAIGNPTKWIPINDNGTIRNIPAW